MLRFKQLKSHLRCCGAAFYCCYPLSLTLQPEQSGGVGSIPGRTPSPVGAVSRSYTTFVLLNPYLLYTTNTGFYEKGLGLFHFIIIHRTCISFLENCCKSQRVPNGVQAKFDSLYSWVSSQSAFNCLWEYSLKKNTPFLRFYVLGFCFRYEPFLNKIMDERGVISLLRLHRPGPHHWSVMARGRGLD